MEIIKGVHQLNRSLDHSVITIGNFDGVHLGHQKIIQTAISKAQTFRSVCLLYTFRPHPQIALRPDSKIQLLSSYDEKLKLIGEMGVDLILEEPFNPTFSKIGPYAFFQDILLKKLNSKAIIVGYDFAFGNERYGHLEMLQALCEEQKVDLTIVSPQKVEGEVVSSSKIRELLVSGALEKAHQFLGRPFSYHGIITRGDERGSKLGFRTANMRPEYPKILLPFGVYATLTVLNGKKIPSVTNIGIRPTFVEGLNNSNPWIETHLIGESTDLYGLSIEVQMIKKLRNEKKFNNLEDLKKQIEKDIQTAKSIFD